MAVAAAAVASCCTCIASADPAPGAPSSRPPFAYVTGGFSIYASDFSTAPFLNNGAQVVSSLWNGPGGGTAVYVQGMLSWFDRFPNPVSFKGLQYGVGLDLAFLPDTLTPEIHVGCHFAVQFDRQPEQWRGLLLELNVYPSLLIYPDLPTVGVVPSFGVGLKLTYLRFSHTDATWNPTFEVRASAQPTLAGQAGDPEPQDLAPGWLMVVSLRVGIDVMPRLPKPLGL